MEEKYQEIYAKLKEESRATLENKNSDKFIDEFKETVRNRLKEVHAKLDEQKEMIIKLALDAYSKEVEVMKTESTSTTTNTTVLPENTNFKSKIQNLIGNLDSVLSKTDTLEETIKVFKENKLSALVEIKDDNFVFKHERKLKYKLMGKVFWDLGWSKSMNKPQNSDINKEDEKTLNVHSNSCYNYFSTDKVITDECVLVVFETDIIKTDAYFYFGVSNDQINYNNNCMCCNVANNVYIKSNGLLCINSSTSTVNCLRFDTGTKNVIEIRVMGRDKNVYFKINNEEEQGPYTLQGNNYTINSGSCNTANGYIKIISSMIIG